MQEIEEPTRINIQETQMATNDETQIEAEQEPMQVDALVIETTETSTTLGTWRKKH
jgi:hypothetical protein